MGSLCEVGGGKATNLRDATGVTGVLFDIQRFSLHDGPGIRTLVFLKGCPLRCLWCCNPESQSPDPEILITPSKCIGCGRCIEACETGAAEVRRQTLARPETCRMCRECVGACPTGALRVAGSSATVEEVVREVERDMPFYRHSGGGVTFSGGEPFFQPLFLRELARACKETGMGTCVETSGYVGWDMFQSALPFIDLVLYDIKHMDRQAHQALVGAGNSLVLANLRQVVASGVPVVARFPAIPGRNDDVANVRRTGELLSSLGVQKVQVLPYHELGRSKYARLGRTYALDATERMTEARAGEIAALLGTYGLKAQVGG